MDFPISVPSIGLVDGKFVDENPYSGMPGSLIPAAWGNSITTEVLNVIEAAGLVTSELDLNQLLQAIRLITQGGTTNFGTDTGAANVYTVAYSPAIPALVNGMLLHFKAKTANTAGSTFSPNGAAIKPLVGLGLAALQGGEIVANGLCTVVYSATQDQWILLSSTGGAVQIPNATRTQHAVPMGQLASLGMIKSIARQVFTTSGTYTPSAGMVFCDVEMVGGGGGGGGAAGGAGSAAGGGGGAGGYARKILTAAQIGASKAVSIGTAGSSAPGSNANGGTGGATTLGALMTANGGIGGGGCPSIGVATVVSTGGAGGAATGGDVNIPGANGFPGFIFAAGVGGLSGQGGGGPFGAGGYPSGPASFGMSGSGRGGGGSGGTANSVGAAGGAGSPGYMVITEYCT